MELIRNVKDWFQQKGDDIFSIDKKVEELIENKMLPDKVYNILDSLDGEKQKSEDTYENAKRMYEEATERKTNYFDAWNDKKAEFKSFKTKHHGFIGKILYNFTPFRFFSVGKQYQSLRREIKILNKEYKFWVRCSNEKNHIFEQADEYRKEKRRALAEYKRIIVKKAKLYKNEFKLISEYDKLKNTQMNHIEEEFGSDVKHSLENYMNLVINNWFDLEKTNTNFDIKAVTKAIIKMRKGQKLNENDKFAFQSIVNNNEPQPTNQEKKASEQDNSEQGNSEQNTQEQDNPEQDNSEHGDSEQDTQGHDNLEQDIPEQDEKSERVNFKNRMEAQMFTKSSIDRSILESLCDNPEELCNRFGKEYKHEGIRKLEIAVKAIKTGKDPIEELESNFGPVNSGLYDEIASYANDYVEKENENEKEKEKEELVKSDISHDIQTIDED